MMTGTITKYYPRPILSVQIKIVRIRKLRTTKSKPTGASFMLLIWGLVFFPSAKGISVVSAIAMHARVNALKDQLQY